MKKRSLTLVAMLLATHIGSSDAAAQTAVGTIADEGCQMDWESMQLYCWVGLTTGDVGPFANDDLYLVDAKHPTWSPNGSRLAFAGQTEPGISVLNLRDWSVIKLYHHGEAPAWSPDGSKLAFAAGELFVMGVDGSNVVQLTNGVGFLGEPAWSPNGQRIAFDCEIDAGNRDICVVHANGTGLTRLTTDPIPDSGPAFSPDGLKIAFAADIPDMGPYVFVMNADGTDRTLVSGAWSDGSTGSCTTSQDGRCTVSRSGISRKTTSISFTVTGVVRATFVYRPEQNHDPDGGSNGTGITVIKS